MCADEGHYDTFMFFLFLCEFEVGVMCADEGHYDNTLPPNMRKTK